MHVWRKSFLLAERLALLYYGKCMCSFGDDGDVGDDDDGQSSASASTF